MSEVDYYIKHGFLAQVYEPWVGFEGSEWGDCMQLLWSAYDRGYIWSDEEKDTLEAILRGHLETAAEDFFFGEGGYDSMYEKEVLDARLRYPDAVAYWKGRSEERWYKQNGAPEMFAEIEASIPDWMKPPPDEEVVDAKRNELVDQLEEIEKKAAKVREELAKLP